MIISLRSIDGILGPEWNDIACLVTYPELFSAMLLGARVHPIRTCRISGREKRPKFFPGVILDEKFTFNPKPQPESDLGCYFMSLEQQQAHTDTTSMQPELLK